jgi:hypothetical protein
MAKPLKLLVRSWVQGKGCVHQRSAAMSEAEAHELLEVGRGAIDKAQESGDIEQVPLVKGRAYVKARRAPDPDEPRRTAPGFLLVSIPDPDAFIRDVVAREFDELLRSAAEATLDQIPTPGEGDLGQQGWKILDIGRQPAASTSKDLLRTWGRQKLGPIATLIVAIVAIYLAYQAWQRLPSQDGHTGSQADQTSDGSYSEESNWKEVQEQIDQVLAADWARKLIDPESPTNKTNRDRLRRFAGLFQRPDLRKELSPKDLKDYGQAKPSSHPFVAFLSRLLEEIPHLEDGGKDLTSIEAMVYLKKLNEELAKSGQSCIDLQLGTPRSLADKARKSLDYRDFFEQTWLKTTLLDSIHRGYWEKNDPLDKSQNDNGAYSWVRPIRTVIEDRYWWR